VLGVYCSGLITVPYNVASHLKFLISVGIAIIIVAAVTYVSVFHILYACLLAGSKLIPVQVQCPAVSYCTF